ncbi:MAG: hypothetical protein AAGK78_15155, partial [Planctomycetota bacterium]
MPVATTSTAADAAARHWNRNHAALPSRWQDRLGDEVPCDAAWVFGRDGSLTARDETGCWRTGTGLPRRVAQAICAQADVARPTLCLLAPPHGQHVRVMLDRSGPTRGLLVVFAGLHDLKFALHTCDFADELATGRLQIAIAGTVAEDVSALVEQVPGFTLPMTIFRPGDAHEGAAALTQVVQQALAEAQQDVGRRLEAASRPPVAEAGPNVVLGGGAFRLWDTPATDLATACDADLLDTDRPTTASMLYVAEHVGKAGRVVTADVLRTDLGEWANPELPWVTWLTKARPAATYTGEASAIIA